MAEIGITIQDLTNGLLSQSELEKLVAGLTEQGLNHYNKSPWVTALASEAFGSLTVLPANTVPNGWHIELLAESNEPGALGYHEDTSTGEGVVAARVSTPHSTRGITKLASGTLVPLAKVFVKTSQEAGVAASEVASHEMLEMLVDPYVTNESEVRKYLRKETHQYYIAEVGDPCQGQGYEAAGAIVANFALPAWWGIGTKPYDYRAILRNPWELAPEGYISVQPEAGGEWEQISGGNPVAEPEPEIQPEPSPEPEGSSLAERVAGLETRVSELEKAEKAGT